MKRLLLILTILAFFIALGTIVFYSLGDHSWIEAAYLAVQTLTTLGVIDPARNETEMVFVMVYLFLGLGIFSYSIFSLGQVIVDTKLREGMKRRQMDKDIQKLNNHYIVCGMGRMGRKICEYLQQRGKPFVVIDRKEEMLDRYCSSRGWLYILGDATDDSSLKTAGIHRAQSLASVLPSDSDNVYVVLSARMLNPNLQIVARASNDKAIQKIERAGATRVISPFSSGAVKIARFMINPSLEDFLEVADDRHGDMELAEFLIPSNYMYIGHKLYETNLREKGIMVLGIRRANGENIFPPGGDSVLHTGDSLLIFGAQGAINTIISNAESAAVE